MTKKQAGVIAVIAFAALIKPMGNLIEFVDIVWCLAVDGVVSPRWRMYNAILQEFGPTAMYWSRVSFDCIVAAIPALLIYRYLRRRDFTQVCMSCAAHKIRAWSLLIAYLALTLLNPSITVQHVPFEAEGIPLDEAMEHRPTATLDEVLAAAPQIEGYRLMRVRGKDDAVCYVCDDVELSMEDIVSARASKSLFNEGFYEVSAKLTPEGRGRLARLTRDYQPHGAKNPSNHGRALAIVVNGELAAAPIIQTEIDMGEFIITGKFTKEEAVNLAAALNSKNSEED